MPGHLECQFVAGNCQANDRGNPQAKTESKNARHCALQRHQAKQSTRCRTHRFHRAEILQIVKRKVVEHLPRDGYTHQKSKGNGNTKVDGNSGLRHPIGNGGPRKVMRGVHREVSLARDAVTQFRHGHSGCRLHKNHAECSAIRWRKSNGSRIRGVDRGNILERRLGLRDTADDRAPLIQFEFLTDFNRTFRTSWIGRIDGLC